MSDDDIKAFNDVFMRALFTDTEAVKNAAEASRRYTRIKMGLPVEPKEEKDEDSSGEDKQ